MRNKLFTENIIIKTTEEMKKEIERKATLKGKTMSDYLRDLIAQKMEEDY